MKAMVALLAAFSSWVFLEFIKDEEEVSAPKSRPHDTKTTPHPHDVELLGKFDETLSIQDRVFLRDHDFRTPTAARRLDGLEELVDGWRGADFQFHDEAVQTAFEKLQHQGAELLELTTHYLFTDHDKPKFMSPLTDMDKRSGTNPETYRRIKVMNDKCKNVVSALNHFVRFSRERLRS